MEDLKYPVYVDETKKGHHRLTDPADNKVTFVPYDFEGRNDDPESAAVNKIDFSKVKNDAFVSRLTGITIFLFMWIASSETRSSYVLES